MFGTSEVQKLSPTAKTVGIATIFAVRIMQNP